MASELSDKICFVCCARPANFLNTSDSELNICEIICRHFWFKEDDLQSAIVCKICWEKIDQFHQFYLDVQRLHGQLDAATISGFIKQEEIEIEEDQLHCTDLSVDDQKPFGIDVKSIGDRALTNNTVHCKLETMAESRGKCKKPLKKESSQKSPKKRKCAQQPFEDQQAMDVFIKQHMVYFCEECNMEFENFRAIRRHQLKTHNKKSVVCCGTQYKTAALLFEHVQNVLNPEAFKCEICSSTYKSHSGYLRHKKDSHTDRKEPIFKCHRCTKSFTKEVILKRHLKGHETVDKGTVKCEFCGKCFGDKRFLRTHVKVVHQKNLDFICEICSKGFHQQGLLITHRKTHELTPEELRKQCPVCNKWMKNHKYWLKHVQRHKDDGNEYKCEVCNHVSINLMALKAHMRYKHAPDRKRYICKLCDKEYSRPATLREHVANSHTREPLYQCQFCEKQFFSNATMYAHRKAEHPQEWLKNHLAKYATTEEISS